MFGDTKLAHNKVSGIFLVSILFSRAASRRAALVCNGLKYSKQSFLFTFINKTRSKC